MTTVNRDKLTSAFPRAAIKQRQGGGGKKLDYVEGHTVINRLNDATDNHWDFRVIKLDSMAVGSGATLMTATVELCLPGLGCRQHIGVQTVHTGGGEDLVKGAITDALKKAATLFGVGIELYGPDYEGGETRHDAPGVAELRRVAPRPTPPPNGAAGPNVGATVVSEPISEVRMKEVHAVGKERGLSHDELHALVVSRGVQTMAELTEPQGVALAAWLRRATPDALRAALAKAGVKLIPDEATPAMAGQAGLDRHTR